MPQKKIVQDIIPTRRRSIRDVTLDDDRPARATYARQSVERTERVPIHIEKEPPAPPKPAMRGPLQRRLAKKGWGGRWLLIVIGFVCCLLVAYGASFFLAQATVTITPKAATVPVSGSYSASVGAATTDLAFVNISTTTAASMSEPATQGPAQEAYATGKAMLLNTTDAPQVIITGTRLSDDRGLIYKTMQTVTIPAATSKGPGGVTVGVIASSPGPSYDSSLNSLSGDLSIVAWVGTARASEFYGRATTDMTGGSSGPTMTVDPSVLKSAESALETRLSSSAPGMMSGLVPSDSILYDDSVDVSFGSPVITSTGSSTANVSMNAIISAPVFKKTDIIDLLAKQQIAAFPANDYSVNGLGSLAFALTSPTAFSPSTNAIEFNLSGSLTIVGDVDQSAVRAALQGHSLADTGSIFGQFSSVIQSARVSIAPFWIHYIPSSADRISVVISANP